MTAVGAWLFLLTYFFFFSYIGYMPSVEPNMELELKTLRSRPELRPRVGCLACRATQVFHYSLFSYYWYSPPPHFICCIIWLSTQLRIPTFFNVYLFILRETTSRGEAERERETENPRQAPCCQHRARWGLQLMSLEIMTWNEIKSQMLHRLSHPGALRIAIYFLQMRSCLRDRWWR